MRQLAGAGGCNAWGQHRKGSESGFGSVHFFLLILCSGFVGQLCTNLFHQMLGFYRGSVWISKEAERSAPVLEHFT